MINRGLFLILFFQISALLAQVTTNQLDSDGKKNGLWRGYYEESKRLRYEGTFLHGKEVGVFKYFDDTPKILAILRGLTPSLPLTVTRTKRRY